MNTFIYALCEPGTRTVRYIGKTTGLKSRLSDHLTKSVEKKTHLGCWLRKLRSLNLRPEMIKLSEVSGDAWKEEETRFILAARVLGMDLVNANDGGVGSTNPSPETRARLSATKQGERNPQFGKTGAASTRFGKSGKDSTFYGRSHSESTLAKMTGRKRSEKTRAAMRAAWVLRKAKTKLQ